MTATVVAVSSGAGHAFSKELAREITLVAGLGVAGDAHCGARVQHRSRVAKDPAQPNLRQVHLIQTELFDELRAEGFTLREGELGENVATRGVDLLALPTGSVLRLGSDALVGLTGLRNPCGQIDGFRAGLLAKLAYKGDDGNVIRKAGVMGVVLMGGVVRAGEAIEIAHPPGPPTPLGCV